MTFAQARDQFSTRMHRHLLHVTQLLSRDFLLRACIPASKGELSCVNKTHGDWNNCPTEDLGRPAQHNHSTPEAHRCA